MKNDCLQELERLYNKVDGKILFAHTMLLNLAYGAKGEEIELNGDKPISESEFNYWKPLNDFVWDEIVKSTLPRRLCYELEANLMEAADKRQVFDPYRSDVEKWMRIDGDTAHNEYAQGIEQYNLPKSTIDRYLSIMGEMVGFYDAIITSGIKSGINEIERKFFATPQREAGTTPQRHKNNQQRKDERDRAKIVAAAEMWNKAVELGLVEQDGGGYRWIETAALYGYFVDVATLNLHIRQKADLRPWRLFKGIITNHLDIYETGRDTMYKIDKGILNYPCGYEKVNSLFC